MANRKLKGMILSLGVAAMGLSAAFSFSSARAAAPPSAVFAASASGVVAPSHAARSSSNTGARVQANHGVRPQPRVAAASRNAARVTSTTSSSAHGTTVPVLSNFDGTSSKDSGIVNFNAEFEPPDQGLCVGNSVVLEPVNSAYRYFDTAGKTLAGPFNVNDLFNEGALQFTSDPRCYFDPTTNTWFAVILFLSTTSTGFGTTSHMDIAVNSTGNPFNIWTEYQFDTTDSHNKGCGPKLGGCFGDQPTLGIDQNNLYVTTNEFGITSNTVNGAQVFAFAKSDLIAGRSAHFALFKNLTNADGSMAFSVQPALTTGTPGAEYFMNSLDPNGTGDNRIGVWALTNGSAVATGGTPTLSTVLINSERYAVPPNAVQKGSTSLLVSDDDRMQQTQYINGSVWGALDTALNISGDTATRAAAAWFRVNPTLSSNRITGATLANEGYVAKTGAYVLYPAIQANSTGDAAMVFTLSGADVFASAAFASLDSSATSFGAIRVAAAGSGPYDPNATRWGDYSWAVLDPTADAFWFATEYMPPLSSQTPDGLRNWGTRVFEVSAG